MAIKRVWIAPNCILCGLSEENCPEVLEINHDVGSAVVIEGVDLSAFEEQIKKAAEDCPVSAIRYEEG